MKQKNKLNTPQEVFKHIISIYEKCNTLNEINKLNSSYLICRAIDECCEDDNLSVTCQKITLDNFNLVDSDLRLGGSYLLNSLVARSEYREKEYIGIKIKYLNDLIKLCNNE